MNDERPGHTTGGNRRAPKPDRREDRAILTGFNTAIVTLFASIFFLSLLGLAL